MKSHTSFKRILGPAIRFAVRRALPIQEFIELVKQLYVQETCRQMDPSVSATVTQISITTGLHRREVNRLLKREPPSNPEEPSNLLMKIIGTWEQSTKFCDREGKPRSLSFEGNSSEFADLVSSLSTDVSPRAIREALLRLGIVEEQHGTLKLIGQAELHLLGDIEGFSQLASDVETIGDATFENLFCRGDRPNLHARTEYDNIYEDSLPVVRQWLIDLGTEIHQRTRHFLSLHDKDISPDPKRKAGATVTLCTFSLTTTRDDLKH